MNKNEVNPLIYYLCLMLWIGGTMVGFSQQKVVSGNVTDENGLPLPGAAIIEQGTTNGTTTDFDGNYSIEVGDNAVLEVSFIGYKKQQIDGSSNEISQISLYPDNQLEEVVVTTGVAVGTATRNLGFSVAKVSLQEIEQVPAADPGNALRGRVSGIRVVQASGNPTSAPQIRLRGSTSISGSQSPLYLVDGNITNGSSRDIPVEDIDAIEIVKGAAASSLYGSLAANGVVQIITKKGKRNKGSLFTLRQEVGFSSINGEYPLTDKHPYKTAPVAMGDWDKNPSTPDTSNFGFDLSSGNRVLDTNTDGRTYFVNNYGSKKYNNSKNIYTEQPYRSTNISFSSGGEKSNTYASFNLLSQGGILEPVDPFTRSSIRLNHEQDFSEKLKLNFSTNYVISNGINLSEQGQGSNVFYSTLIVEPFINIKEKHPDGYFSPVPAGYKVQASNFQNPLYVVDVAKFDFTNKRFLAGVNAEYELFENFTLNARQSIDRNSINYINSVPKGFVTPTPSATQNNGFLSITQLESEALISSLGFTYKFDFDQLSGALTAKYLFEKRKNSTVGSSGYDFIANGVMNLENTLTENQRVTSQIEDEIAKNYFLNLDLNYNDRYIVSGLIRNDESSLFGKDNRSRIYGRGTVAYIASEDFDINGVDFLKFRASYGTSGLRPTWNAQYETFSVTTSSITPCILGNNDLRPSVTSELELGLDVSFLSNFSFEFNYSNTKTKDDFLLVPLSSVAGYYAQWKNIGGLESTYYEAGLRGEFLEGDGLRWRFNLVFDTGTQIISDLGDVPPFTRSGLGAVDIFRVEEGKPYGTLYGYKYARSLDELSQVNGSVVNIPASASSSPGGSISDYEVNQFGYVVRTEDVGTSKEAPMMIYDEEKNDTAVTEIGNTNPNFNMGFSSTLYYKDFSLYFLLDYQNGGDIYNFTKQLLYFNERHLDLEKFGTARKEQNYAQNIYNQSNPNSHFVEDGSYAKIREISLAYNIAGSDLGVIGKSIKQIKIQLSGRNLFTFTNYSGWDPEVAISTNPTNFRLDEYSYPNFRTYSAALTLKF